MSLTILDVLSKGLIEELDLLKKPKKPVEFRLIASGVVDSTSTKKVTGPQHYGFPGESMIRDPHDDYATVKKVKNIIGYNTVQGKPGEPAIQDPITEYIHFSSGGSIWCQPHEYNKYLYLKVNSRNRDYPYRDPSKTPKYYEVNEEREVELKNNEFVYSVLAGNLLMDLDSPTIFDLARKVQKTFPQRHVFTLTDAESMLLKLQSIAKTNPVDLIVAAQEPASYARVLADDAVSRRLIFFDDHKERLTWAWKRTPGQKGKKNIVKLADGNNSVKGLVDYLQTAEGNEHLLELKGLHEEHYRIR